MTGARQSELVAPTVLTSASAPTLDAVRRVSSAGMRFWHPRRRVASQDELSRRERMVLGLVGSCAILGLWQLLASTNAINPLISSSPWSVIEAARMLAADGQLGSASWQSAELFLVGFGIALGAGLLIGVYIGWYKRVAAVLDPLVSLLYAAPRIALIPLISVWFGVGFETQVVVVMLMAVFPIIINVASGVATIDRSHLALARAYMGSNLAVLRTVAIPGAVPAIVSGVRQGIAQSLIGVVVAEYLLGNNGIGGLIVNAGSLVQSGTVFVGVLVVALAALLLTGLLRRLERRLDHWRA
jgi:NitT/TauT family transport system permease protein